MVAENEVDGVVIRSGRKRRLHFKIFYTKVKEKRLHFDFSVAVRTEVRTYVMYGLKVVPNDSGSPAAEHASVRICVTRIAIIHHYALDRGTSGSRVDNLSRPRVNVELKTQRYEFSNIIGLLVYVVLTVSVTWDIFRLEAFLALAADENFEFPVYIEPDLVQQLAGDQVTTTCIENNPLCITKPVS